VFSGNRNFFFTYAPEAKLEVVTHELGKTYEIMNASIKKWSVGVPMLACLEAIETLRAGNPFRSEDVEKVVVTVAEKEAPVVDNRQAPDICMQHLVALMLLDGGLTFKAAHDFKRMRDPRVLKMRKRVVLVGSGHLTDVKRRWHGEAEIHLRDGRVLKHYTPAVRGSSFNPLTPDEESAKALDLMAPVLGKARAARLIDTVWHIEKVTDMRELRALCRT
jgi:2-methylcitrate dehydratase PrpD